MKTFISLIGITLILTLSVAAQTPTIDSGGVVNAASYAYAGLPSGGIAPGSIFAVFGNNLGPAQFVQAGAYPIPTSLGGTIVKVTGGSTTANAYLFLSSAKQLTAMLPSTIPVGTASLTVTYNGATSAPQSITVSASSFGTFAANAGGSGPGIIANGNSVLFGLTTAANPGDAAVIWGTGLTAVQGNEAGGALPGDLPNLPVEVYVGTTKATVTYRGRSGCCAGLDQIVFTVPAVTGCRVPVTVKINNIVSNYTTMSIAPSGGRTCSDPGGPSAADMQKYQQNGTSTGAVTLSRSSSTITIAGFGSITTVADLGAAAFYRYTPAQLNASQNPFGTIQLGSCSVYYFKGASASNTDPTQPKFLDAGSQITVNGAGGVRQLVKTVAGSSITYSGLLNTPGGAGYLEPGTFTATGPAGPDVGGFSTSMTIPVAVTWTNQAAVTDVTRASGQLVTWSGGDASSTVMIVGNSSSGTDANSIGAGFTCYAKASDGQFTVPSQVLLAMPPSVVVSGTSTGALLVGSYGTPKAFTASGVDTAYFVYTSTTLKNLNYK